MTDNTETILKRALESHGAREFEVAALSLDSGRGLAALNYALEKGADNPIAYAIKMFDSDWEPSGQKRRLETNQSVDKKCSHCDGDRFVTVTDGLGQYEETYAPCSFCNAEANTSFWRVDGTLVKAEAR